MPQKGPRAYIIFSMGEAVEVHDLAKHARERVKEMRTTHPDAAYQRFGSRLAAEEFASWHNYRRHAAQMKWRAEAEARRAARVERALIISERQLPLWPNSQISCPPMARTIYPTRRRP